MKYAFVLASLLMSLLSAHSVAETDVFKLEATSVDAVIKGEISFPPGNVGGVDTDTDTAVIIVGGSGVRLRADTAAMNGLFHGMGYAVVNYDRRGNGESSGEYQRPSSKNSAQQIPKFAQDVAAVAESVKQDTRFNIRKVIVMGASMGGWIVPLAASKTEAIDGVVSFVGAAATVGQSDHFDFLTDMGLSIEQALGLMHTLQNDSSYDPELALRQMAQPGLWIYAELDDSNPTAFDLMQLTLIKTALDKDFSIKVYADTDHEMKNLKTGQMEQRWVSHLKQWIDSQHAAQ